MKTPARRPRLLLVLSELAAVGSRALNVAAFGGATHQLFSSRCWLKGGGDGKPPPSGSWATRAGS